MPQPPFRVAIRGTKFPTRGAINFRDDAAAAKDNASGDSTDVTFATATESTKGWLAAKDQKQLNHLPIDATLPPYNVQRTTLPITDPGWFAAFSALAPAQDGIKAAWNDAVKTGRPLKTPNGVYKFTDRCELVGNISALQQVFDGDGSTFVWDGGFDSTCKNPIPMLHFAGLYGGAIGNFNIITVDPNHHLAEGIRLTSGGVFGPAIAIIDSTDTNPIRLHTAPHGLAPGAPAYALVSNHLVNTNANQTDDVACSHHAVAVQAVDATHLDILNVPGNGAGPGSGGTIQFNIANLTFNCKFHDIDINGGIDSIEIAIRIGAKQHGSLDANNDGNTFENIYTRNYGDCAINIQDTQAYDQNFRQCRDIGFIGSLRGIWGPGAFGATITNNASVNIVSTTAAKPVVVETDSPHGLVDGNVAVIVGAEVPALDGGWIITKVDDRRFSLNDSENPGTAGGMVGTTYRQTITITRDASGTPMVTRKDLRKVFEIPGVDATREDGDLRGYVCAFDATAKTAVFRTMTNYTNTGKVIVATSTGANLDVIFGSQAGHRSGSLIAGTGDGGSFYYFGGMTDNHLSATYITTAQGNPCRVYGRADSEGTRRFHYHFGAASGAAKSIEFDSLRLAGIGVRKGDPIISVLFSNNIIYRHVQFGDPDVDTELGDGLKYDFTIEYQPSAAQYANLVFEDCNITTRRANGGGVDGGPGASFGDKLFPYNQYPRFVRTRMNRNGGQTVLLTERIFIVEFPRFNPEALDFYSHESQVVQVNGDTRFTFDEYEGPNVAYGKPRCGLGGSPMRLTMRTVADQKGKQFRTQAKDTTEVFWLGEGEPLLPCGETSTGHSRVYRQIEYWYEQNGSYIEYAGGAVVIAKTSDGGIVRFDYVTAVDNDTEYMAAWPIPYAATCAYEIVEAHAHSATGPHEAFWTGARKGFYKRSASIDPTASKLRLVD